MIYVKLSVVHLTHQEVIVFHVQGLLDSGVHETHLGMVTRIVKLSNWQLVVTLRAIHVFYQNFIS